MTWYPKIVFYVSETLKIPYFEPIFLEKRIFLLFFLEFCMRMRGVFVGKKQSREAKKWIKQTKKWVNIWIWTLLKDQKKGFHLIKRWNPLTGFLIGGCTRICTIGILLFIDSYELDVYIKKPVPSNLAPNGPFLERPFGLRRLRQRAVAEGNV
jgi:hypothetical protein